MKYNKIIFLFAVFLPVSIVLRLVQLSFTVDYSTGFFVREFASNGEAMLWVVVALCFAPAIFALFSHRSPENAPPPNIALSIASFAAAFSVIYELIFEEFAPNVLGWQMAAVKIAGVATALFFVAFGLLRFVFIKLHPICMVVPAAYFILRMICDFTTISSLALISENLMLMLTYSMILLFFVQFAKLYIGLDSEYNFRKILSSGIAAIILGLTQTVPHLVLKLVTGYSFMHTSLAANVNIFFIVIFIAVFIFSHFSYKNACIYQENSEDEEFFVK